MGRFAVRAATFADAPALMELEAAARACASSPPSAASRFVG
jgi:hypothetical protein